MRRQGNRGRSGNEPPNPRHPSGLRAGAAFLRPARARWTSLLALAGAMLVPSAPASADGAAQATTAVVPPDSAHSSDARLAGAVERVLRAKVDDLEVVTVAGTPGLGLSDLQLAVGCVAETDACLQAVAEQLEVEALLLSSIHRVDDTLVLTVTYFDAREGKRQSVMRREAGGAAGNRLLEGIEPLLRELFGLEPPATLQVTTEGIEDEAEQRGRPALPFVVGGIGLAGLISGGALGLVARRTHNEYASTAVDSPADAQRAADLLVESRRQARAAQAMLGAGGALVIAGIVLYFVMGRDDDEMTRDLTVLPSLGPDGAGLHLAGRFGAAR